MDRVKAMTLPPFLPTGSSTNTGLKKKAVASITGSSNTAAAGKKMNEISLEIKKLVVANLVKSLKARIIKKKKKMFLSSLVRYQERTT